MTYLQLHLLSFLISKCRLCFKVVDMRWGVRDEMTNEHMTTELCLSELKSCQQLSIGPNFVYFGGQKYGYRPIPTFIPTEELTLIKVLNRHKKVEIKD